MSAIEVIKEHPYIAGGAVLVTVVVVLLVVGGGGSKGDAGSVVPSGSADNGQAYAAIATAQIGANAHANEVSAQLDALNISANVATHNADLQFGQKMQEDTLSAEVAKAGLTTQQNIAFAQMSTQQMIELGNQETQRYVVGTQAGERINEVNSIRDMNASHDASVTKMNADNLSALTTQMTLNAQTANHQIDANVAINTTNAAASEAQAKLYTDAANFARDRDLQALVFRTNTNVNLIGMGLPPIA